MYVLISQEDETRLSSFLTETLDQYIVRMSTDGCYVDHIVVEHTAKMLDKTIVVIEQDNEHTMGSAVESITLGYMRDAQHYVSITVVKVPEFGSRN